VVSPSEEVHFMPTSMTGARSMSLTCLEKAALENLLNLRVGCFSAVTFLMVDYLGFSGLDYNNLHQNIS